MGNLDNKNENNDVNMQDFECTPPVSPPEVGNEDEKVGEVVEEVVEETTEEVEEEAAKETAENEEEIKDNSEEESNSSDSENAKIAELNDRIMRQMAEFENFRRRSEKEKAGMYDMGAVSVLEKILPVIDNFERGLDSADESPFAEGMKMIYKQLMTSMEEIGVTPIAALGKTFDPDLHNAVMHEDDPEKGENEITMELQKGYKFHDSVVRHSMVKVAN